MTKNPFYNAIAASVYIILVVSLLTITSEFSNSIAGGSGEDSFLAPIMMISLLTLSVAVMGYIFGYQPIMLYLDGKKEQAVKLFLQTVGIFGGITFLIFILYLTGILS